MAIPVASNGVSDAGTRDVDGLADHELPRNLALEKPRNPLEAVTHKVFAATTVPRRALLKRIRGYPSRRWLERHGLRLGRDVYIDDFAAFDHGFLWLISIGDEAVLSPGVRIIAHDGSTKHWTGYIRVGRVDIGRKAYLGANAIVLPGVRIGDHAVVGAGSVVRSDVRPGSIVLGNPCVEVGSVESFTSKHLERMRERPCYPRAGFSTYDYATPSNTRKMREDLADGCGYVE